MDYNKPRIIPKNSVVKQQCLDIISSVGFSNSRTPLLRRIRRCQIRIYYLAQRQSKVVEVFFICARVRIQFALSCCW